MLKIPKQDFAWEPTWIPMKEFIQELIQESFLPITDIRDTNFHSMVSQVGFHPEKKKFFLNKIQWNFFNKFLFKTYL